MPEGPPPKESPTRPETSGGTATEQDRDLWRHLAQATTDEEFCQSWLVLQARMIGGVSSGLVLLEREGAGGFAPVAVHPRGSREAESLTGVVERALKEAKGVVVRNDTDGELDSPDDLRFQLAYPVQTGNRLHGIAAVEITPRAQTHLQSAMRQLQWGVAWLQNWALRKRSAPDANVRARLASALELTALTLENERFKPAATTLVTELASRLECDRVSVGFVDGKQVKVHALSHSAAFGKQMNLIRSIGLAMSESVDQQAVLTYPEPDDASHRVLHAHEQLARGHGDRAICTIPFVGPDGRAFGALTLERSAPLPFDDPTLEMCEGIAALAGPILEEKRRNDRWLIAKVRDSLGSQVKKLIGPRYAVRKVVAAGLVALVVFLTFGKGLYRVTAKTVLEGEIQRVVAAPYRGFIFSAPVRAGDVVTEGQTLCTLDERDMRLEYSKWSSEREQYLLEHRKYMAEGDVATMKVLRNKMRQAEAQIALLEEQLARARIVAPFDGLVVSGDLSQSLGAPVEAGEVLFEVAPLEAYRVMLQVDEGDIREIRVGQEGKLILTSLPREEFRFTVTKITPVSVSEEGRNYFLAEGELDRISDRLRPGMEGFGKIEVGRRKLIWIWTHKLIEWVRLWFWSWWP